VPSAPACMVVARQQYIALAIAILQAENIHPAATADVFSPSIRSLRTGRPHCPRALTLLLLRHKWAAGRMDSLSTCNVIPLSRATECAGRKSRF
jgi:hypothetical protein